MQKVLVVSCAPAAKRFAGKRVSNGYEAIKKERLRWSQAVKAIPEVFSLVLNIHSSLRFILTFQLSTLQCTAM